MSKKIAVIGAGITGVTTAYALARRGFDVAVIEQHRYAGMETSFANGGQLSASNAEVWNHPSTILKGLRWMLKQDAPLLVNPKFGWHKLSWFMEFVAGMSRYEHNTIVTAKLAIAAREHMLGWAREEGIEFDASHRGILHVYRDKAGFEHARQVTRLLGRAGLERRAVTPADIRSLEPALTGTFHGGFFTESDFTGDIHKFTTQLATACSRRGVRFLYDRGVASLRVQGGRVRVETLVDGAADTQDYDAAVICAGTASRGLGAQVGDRVNVYPVKGYSITVPLGDAASQQAAPQVSLLDDEAKIVTSRLGVDRFRVAGTAEFNGFNRDIRADRIRPLVDWVRRLFPGVSTRACVPWAGLRPMMPDMLPRVGRGRSPQIFYNTGHGHLGWTLSCGTADAVAGSIQMHWNR